MSDSKTGSRNQHRTSDLVGLFLRHDFRDHVFGSEDQLGDEPVGSSQVGNITLTSDEVRLVQEWDRITHDVLDSKFECCVTSTYTSSSFDGLNRSLTDKYLSDDLVHGFELPDLLTGGLAGRFFGWAPGAGYGAFDYADFESIALEDEWLDDDELRQEYRTQRRGSLFSRPATRAAARGSRPGVERSEGTGSGTVRPHARRSALAAFAGMDEAALLRASALDGGELGDGARPEADVPRWVSDLQGYRSDMAFAHPYPASMGRAGSTLLSRPQRMLARMRSAGRPVQRDTARQMARMLARNERVTGPVVSRPQSLGQSPIWSPLAVDSVRTERMYGGQLADGIASADMLFVEPTEALAPGAGMVADTARYPAGGAATVSPRAVSPRAVSPRAVSPRAVSPRAVSPRAVSPHAAATRGEAPGQTAFGPSPAMRARRALGPVRAAGTFGPAATQVMLDGLVVSGREMPALAGALEVAHAAFGAPAAPGRADPEQLRRAAGRPGIGGVFSPTRMERALGIVTLDAATASVQPAAAGAYEALLYDAAEHTWLQSSDPAVLIDAAAGQASAVRAGRPVPARTALARQIARSVPRGATPAEVAHLARIATTDALSAPVGAAGVAPRAAHALPGLSPMVAPVPGLVGADSAELARDVARLVAARPVAGPRPLATPLATSPARAAAALRGASSARAGTDSPFVPAGTEGQTPPVRMPARMTLSQVVPSAAARSAAGALAHIGHPALSAASAADAVRLLEGRLPEGRRLPRTSAARGEDAADALTLSIDPATGMPVLRPVAETAAPFTAGPWAGMFTAGVGAGLTRMGVTSTGPELFAARQLNDGAPVMAQLTRPSEGPVTIAGEVRYGYGALGVPMDDPVVYLQLESGEAPLAPAQSPGLSRRTGTTVARASRMSPAVAANLRSVSMPLSSAARLDRVLRQARPEPRIGAARVGATDPGAVGRFDASSAESIPAAPGAFDAARTASLAGPEAFARLFRRGAMEISGQIPEQLQAQEALRTPARAGTAVAAQQDLRGPEAAEAALFGRPDAYPGMGAVPSILRSAGGHVSRLGVRPPATLPAAALAAMAAAGQLPAGQESTGQDQPVFYQYSYDAETTFVEARFVEAQPVEAPYDSGLGDVAGGHVEIRGGRVVRAVPATAAAQRTAATRPARIAGEPGTTAATSEARASARILPSPVAAALAPSVARSAGAPQSRRLGGRATDLRPADGVLSAATTPVLSGASRIEAGFPALSIQAPGASVEALRVAALPGSSKAVGALAAIAEADLAMLPGAVRDLLGRQARGGLAMTGAGTDAVALLERLGALADPSSPATRTALLHRLSAMGVDTPELLRVLDEGPAAVARADSVQGDLGRRDVLSKLDTLTGRDALAAVERVSRLEGPARQDAIARLRFTPEHAAISKLLDSAPEAVALDVGTGLDDAQAETGAPGAVARRSEQLAKQLRRIAAQVTGVSSAGASEVSVLGSEPYWGPFGPSRVAHAGAAELLESMLRVRPGGSRASALVFGAELGEMLALGSPEAGGVGTGRIAEAQALGRRKSATGAPSRSRHVTQAERQARKAELRAERAAKAAARTPAASALTGVAGRTEAMAGKEPRGVGATTIGSWDAQVLPLPQLEAERGPGAAVRAIEAFADDVAGAIATSLQSGAPARISTAAAGTGAGFGAESMPLMAATPVMVTPAFESGLADRVAGASAPWVAGQRVQAGKQAGGIAGTSQRAPASERFPILQALSEQVESPLAGAGGAGGARSMELGAPETTLVTGEGAGSDGSRDFRALGSEAVARILELLPGGRDVSTSLAGNFDLAYTVLDRANGAFAGLHAGVLEDLTRQLAARARAAGEEPGRTIYPGLDEWPAQTMETLQAAGFGHGAGEPSRSSTELAKAEDRVVRLERRVGAAREAYERLRGQAAPRTAAGRSLESMDWRLVHTGSEASTPVGADLGRLAGTMVSQKAIPAAEMSYVAPAVKVVAQAAQLKGRGESVASDAVRDENAQQKRKAGPGETKKIDYEGLARKVLGSLTFRNKRDHYRYGKY